MLNEKFRTGEDILGGLVEKEAQRTYIDMMATALAGIQKFYVAVLEKPELQTFRGIVYFGRDYGVGQFNLVGKLLIDVQQGGSFRETLGHVVVLAAYL